jgi:aryl-alcohol dehydrogenase-like predicted oxidoreductase
VTTNLSPSPRRRPERPGLAVRAGGDIAPIPGTRRSERVEENVGADAIELSAGQLNRLNDVEPPVVTATPI